MLLEFEVEAALLLAVQPSCLDSRVARQGPAWLVGGNHFSNILTNYNLSSEDMELISRAQKSNLVESSQFGCTLQQLSVMLTQFKLFDKLDRSNFPISLWKQKGNSCFILTTIQVNERKSRSLSPLEWKILLIIFWKVIFDILKTFCHNTLLIISIFLFDFTLITSWIVKE